MMDPNMMINPRSYVSTAISQVILQKSIVLRVVVPITKTDIEDVGGEPRGKRKTPARKKP